MYFDDEFLETLPEEPYAAIVAMCDKFDYIYNDRRKEEQTYRLLKTTAYEPPAMSTEERFDLVLEVFALIANYSETHGLEITIPQISDYEDDDLRKSCEFISSLRDSSEKEARARQFYRYRSLFGTKLGTTFCYEFSAGDLEQVQDRVDKLRGLISESQEFREDHKNRLLNKLEKLQSELHKRVSDLDRFWGFFIDASIVLGQVGENAKPMVEVIKEIVGLIWPAQTRAYELPSNLPFKLLGQSEDEKS